MVSSGSLGVPHQAFTKPPFYWAGSPVVDAHSWVGWRLLLGFNDTFFMALMFFISGLFVPASLARKGAGGFLCGRLTRLWIPFLVCAAVLAPLAYYPAYLLSGAAPGFGPYAKAWLSLPQWHSGPAWFLGVLIALAAVTAAIHAIAPRAMADLGRLGAGADRKPGRFFLGLALASAAVDIPACWALGPMEWLQLGPFSIQASRIGHYPLYFFAGVAVGAHGLDRGLLAVGGELARRWWLWALAAVPAFLALTALTFAATVAKGQPAALWYIAGGSLFALTCAAASFMAIGIFRRVVRGPNRVWDSLSADAYGMYLVHYAFVSWMQLALLPAELPGLAKGLIVTATVVALSWATTAALRRIPGAARIL